MVDVECERDLTAQVCGPRCTDGSEGSSSRETRELSPFSVPSWRPAANVSCPWGHLPSKSSDISADPFYLCSLCQRMSISLWVSILGTFVNLPIWRETQKSVNLQRDWSGKGRTLSESRPSCSCCCCVCSGTGGRSWHPGDTR